MNEADLSYWCGRLSASLHTALTHGLEIESVRRSCERAYAEYQEARCARDTDKTFSPPHPLGLLADATRPEPDYPFAPLASRRAGP